MSVDDPYFLYPAELEMAWAYAYNKRKWGEAHADRYIEKMIQAIRDRQKSGDHQLYADSEKIFSKSRAADIVRESIYCFHFKEKPSQKRGYRIFYRKMSGKNIGVIAILQDGADFPERVRKNLESVVSEIRRDRRRDDR